MWFVWLTNRLFGWHWIAVQFGYTDYFRRIKRAPNGRPYIKLYGDIEFLDEMHRPTKPLTWTEDNVRPLRKAAR